MIRKVALASVSALVAGVYAQQVGTQLAETHPKLTWSTCSAGGSCTTTTSPVVLDANWRWLHTTSGYTNCYTGNAWDTSLCPNPTTCASNCALDGADYSGTYGITTSGNALTLKFKMSANVGSRTYLMASDTAYQIFKLKNREFTFDVDMSALGCGLNGAVYFSEMAADGGATKGNNKAGAKYGTGYCDSQCPHDLKFINGEANTIGWTGTSTNSGTGQYGSCCSEMDIWEANRYASAYTPHGCTTSGLYRCSGTECGDGDNRHGGVCDKDGCDFNSFRMGDQTFLGEGKTVDTKQKITVVTQFLTEGNTDTGKLKEIRRVYVQGGKVIQNSHVNIPGMSSSYDSITEQFCADQKTAFGDVNDFATKGGFTPMDKAMTNGMVLVMSIWDDYAVNMLWLDSNYPTDADPSKPGIARGTCATTSGAPADVESQQASAQVIYSNIKFGPIGSTYPSAGTSSSARPPSSTAKPPSSTAKPPSSTARPPSSTVRTTSTSTRANQPTQTHYGQCGGIGYTGPTVCASPYTCKKSNDYYSQCL